MRKENKLLQRRHWGVDRGYTSIYPREINGLIKNALFAEQVMQINEPTDEDSGAILACEVVKQVFGAAASINGHNHILDREVWAGILEGLMGEMREWAMERIAYGEQNTSRYMGFQNKLRGIFESIIGSDNRKFHPDHHPSPLLHWDVIGLHAADLSTMAACTENTYYRLGRLNLYDKVIQHRNEKDRVFVMTEEPEIQGIVVDAINAGALPRLDTDQKKEYLDGVNMGLIYLFPYYYLDVK